MFVGYCKKFMYREMVHLFIFHGGIIMIQFALDCSNYVQR
jgi:ABC-type glucose/galactose transport system permease subunit